MRHGWGYGEHQVMQTSNKVQRHMPATCHENEPTAKQQLNYAAALESNGFVRSTWGKGGKKGEMKRAEGYCIGGRPGGEAARLHTLHDP
jgi:hypothetical protein